MSRLSKIFAKNRKCFIPYVTAGHPDLDTTREIVLHLAESGAHVVEIGIPFSDPIADGPIIQKASFQALQHGYSFSDYIDLVAEIRTRTEVGLVFMSYMNPVLSYGLENLDREGFRAGLDGVLITDLTPEEYSRMEPLKELDTIFLAAPTSSDERLQKICDVSQGFLYLVARTGVTGKQTDVEAAVPKTVELLRRYTRLPIAVGFGITSKEDVRKVWQYADAAVVGSAIVGFIEEHRADAELVKKVGEYVRKSLLSGS